MNFKNKKPRSGRAGCGMCKPQKKGWVKETELGHQGFGKLRKELVAKDEIKRFTKR